MNKNWIKISVALIFAFGMACGLVGIASASDIANGTNVAEGCSWSSFSVCTREDGGEWEDALRGIQNDLYPDGMIKGVDYATEGWIDNTYDGDGVCWHIENTGWDGLYDPNENLVGDNPSGLTLTMYDIPIELCRHYTISFKIRSTLKNEYTDTKHIYLKPLEWQGKYGMELNPVEGITTGGYIVLNYSEDEDDWQTVEFEVDIPNDEKIWGYLREDASGNEYYYYKEIMHLQFSAGAMMVSYPEEIALSGNIYISDFKVTAGDMAERVTTAVNVEEKKTVPARASITTIKKKLVKRSVKLTWGKVANATSYDVQYAQNKKFNKKGKKKTKTTKKTSITIKNLKVMKKYFFRVRAVNEIGNGKWSKIKKITMKKTKKK